MIRSGRGSGSLVAGIVCALSGLVLTGSLSADSPESEENAAPKTLFFESRSLPLLPSLSAIIPHRIRDKTLEKEPVIYNELPGFGVPSTHGARYAAADSTSSVHLGEHFLGGSLELAAVGERLIPAIYIEGEGYVPIEHPAIYPHLEPGRDRPETNPQIVMVPEYRLAGYDEPSASPARMVDGSGPTLLSMPLVQEDIEPIIVAAQTGWSKQTDEYDIFFLKGDCSIRQGRNAVQGPLAVVWVARENDPATGQREVTVYLESDSSEKPLYLELDPEKLDAKIYDKKWFGRLNTRATVQTLVMTPEEPQEREPAIYHRALAMMSRDYSVIRQAQFVAEASQPAPKSSTPPRYRRISLNSRGDNLMDIRFDPYPNNPERGIVVITKGLNLIIEGVTGEDLLLGDVVDISADHAVIWSSNPRNLRSGGQSKEDSGNDFEVYLEGNIAFRDGPRTIQAHRMYYDARNRIAYILDGHLSTPIEGIKGIKGSIRIKAEVLQQLGDGLFSAKNTLVTTSQLGEPTYSLRSRSMTLNERIDSGSWMTGGEPMKRQILIAENNYMAMRNVPVFYWPWMAADLKDPTFYIKNISYGNSTTDGNQIKTTWNPFQLLNIRNRPNWLDAGLSLNWSENRGLGHGINMDYSPSSCLMIPGPTDGDLYFWGLYDRGSTDRLGGGRKKVPFPDKYRHFVRWRHRQEFDTLWKYQGDWSLSAQVGKVSDRNYLNAYHSGFWGKEDNATTSVQLKKTGDASTLSLSVEYALDDFYTNANRLPRLDHYILGKSLLNDRLTWYGHTRVGLVDYNTAEEPYAPDYTAWQQDSRYFRYLPWELTTTSPTAAPYNPRYPNDPQAETIDATFETFSTRHELDLPFNLGPVRCVPYVLGDFSHWGKNRSGDDVQRFYGQGGIRLNLPLWKIKPNCSSRTWYVNGLAHKIDFDAELSYARSDHNMDDLILTDALDNWSIEDFRRRYSVTTFGSNGSQIPTMFDPRYYALRSGIAGNVTAGNMEIADDLTLCRFGMTHRFQTKRGPVGRRYIVDWITFSTHFNYYPESEQNFGESIGLIDYDFLWHVGDRFSLFSSGLYDLFGEEQYVTRIGGQWNRPNRGNFGVMLDRLQGAIGRTYLTLNVAYTMNEKYSMSYATSFDVNDQWRNTGHNFIFTRTGEAFRLMVGAVYSESKDEWSFSIGIEPVFMRGIAKKMSDMSKKAQSEFD